MAARRPRRRVLATVSIVITVIGILAAMSAHAELLQHPNGPRTERLNDVLLAITLARR